MEKPSYNNKAFMKNEIQGKWINFLAQIKYYGSNSVQTITSRNLYSIRFRK